MRTASSFTVVEDCGGIGGAGPTAMLELAQRWGKKVDILSERVVKHCITESEVNIDRVWMGPK